MKILKKEIKGITLVLLILSGVAINLTLGKRCNNRFSNEFFE